MKTLCILLLLCNIFYWSTCVKILGVFSPPVRSHYILGSALMRSLAEKGHDVTIIAPFVDNNPPKNSSFRQIILTGLLDEHKKRLKDRNIYEMEQANTFLLLPFIINIMYELAATTLSHVNVQNLLKSDETFDVVIVEQFLNEAHKGFASHFSAPLIMFSTVGANTWTNMLLGNPSPPSYVPDVLLSYSSSMTFWERTVNTLFNVYGQILYNFYAFPRHKSLYDKYFPNSPNFYDTLHNISITLLNSHPSTNQPVPYVPNMIDIGGFHVQPAKTLPTDLQKFLDEAKEGVIYFSMGSNIKSSDMPPDKMETFIKTFSKLKQQVLWKWEQDVLPGQPQNVKVGKWLPQQEILAHPNVKLFISHGGLLSTTETIYHGVPVLAIPMAGDQKLNAQNIVNGGFGLQISFSQITEKHLMEKLQELLANPKYAQNAKKRSELFHDRQVKPLDTAIYWVEYVIRHAGAPHLRVAGVDLPFYKYLLLDVGAFILVIVFVGIYLAFKIVKALRCRCSQSNQKKNKTKLKSN